MPAHTAKTEHLATTVAVLGAGPMGTEVAHLLARDPRRTVVLISTGTTAEIDEMVVAHRVGRGRGKGRCNTQDAAGVAADRDNLRIQSDAGVIHLHPDGTLDAIDSCGSVRIDAHAVLIAAESARSSSETSRRLIHSLVLDARTGGFVTDRYSSTSQQGVFAAMDLAVPVVGGKDSRRESEFLTAGIDKFLTNSHRASQLSELAGTTGRWHLSPDEIHDRVADGAADYCVRSHRFFRFPRLTVVQRGTAIGTRIFPKPIRQHNVTRVPRSLFANVCRNGGPVTLLLGSALDMPPGWTPNLLGDYIIPRSS